MTLVQEEQYRFSEAFKDYFKKHLNENTLNIVNYKLGKQRNKEAFDFESIISPELLNSVFQKLLDNADLNQFVFSIKQANELYAFMYILASIWIQFLQSERHIAEAIDSCGDLIMWEIAKFMGIEFEVYETQCSTPSHTYYRDSIYTKPKIIAHFDFLVGHIEPLISDEKRSDFIKLLSSNEIVKIDRGMSRERDVFWWGYASRLVDFIKPLIFTSNKKHNNYELSSINDSISPTNRASSKVKFRL